MIQKERESGIELFGIIAGIAIIVLSQVLQLPLKTL